jgi:hypothetical protein
VDAIFALGDQATLNTTTGRRNVLCDDNKGGGVACGSARASSSGVSTAVEGAFSAG